MDRLDIGALMLLLPIVGGALFAVYMLFAEFPLISLGMLISIAYFGIAAWLMRD